MNHIALASVLGAALTACAAPITTAEQPLRSLDTGDPALARVTAGDCTEWSPSQALRDQVRIESTDASVCVTLRRAIARPTRGPVTARTPVFAVRSAEHTTGWFALMPTSRLGRYGYCRIDNHLRAVELYEFVGCTSNDGAIAADDTALDVVARR